MRRMKDWLVRIALIVPMFVVLAGPGLLAGVGAARANFAVEMSGTHDPADRRFEMPTVSGTRDDFNRALRAPVEGFLEAAATIHRKLLPWGLDLLALLTGLSLTWIGLKAMLDRATPGLLMTEFLTLSLTAGILFSLLDNWGTVTAGILGGAGDLSRQVSGNVHDGASAIHGVQRVLDAGFALWEHPQAGIAALRDPLVSIATLLFKLLATALLLVCGCIYLGIYLMSMTLLSIAFALGPVFIPWLLLRPASFLFDGWLRFTLVAALYQVVGMVIVTLVSRMHEPMLATVGPAIGDGSAAFNFYYFAAAFLLSGVSALMMLQVPAIASGLVNGSVAARFQTGTAVVAASDRGARSGARMIARSGAQLMAGLGQARAGRTAQAQGPTSLPRIEPSMVGSSQAR